jgi:hypothetical protein
MRLPGQTSPFVDEKTERLLVNELSGDIALETMRVTTRGHKLSGSADFFDTARHVMEKAKAYDLEDVRWIDQKGEHAYWQCRRAEAWLVDGEGDKEKRVRLGSYEEAAVSIADYSRPADVTAELVDVGAGDRAQDYEGKPVRGKIVLSYGNPTAVTEQAVWKRGAAGILSWSSTRLNPLADAPDQIAWQRVPRKDGPKGEKTTFAFVLSARDGKALADRLRGEAVRRIFANGELPPPGRPLRARVVVDSEFLPDKTAMVEARIRGTDPALPEIVLTGHLQESQPSANDDQSGVASVLEIGRAVTRLIREGALPRPLRGIRFWWCDEIYSEYRYFADKPGEEKGFLANLNQDMVGARQSEGGRVQYMARPPWSRASFLPDVQESILEMVVAGNNGYLAALQAGSIPPGVPFSKPIYSRRGTREPYHARAVPYFGNTDHLVFNDSWVGVPGTSLTNWPDEFIHSSADDLWQIDPTQLKRNAFVVAATAWWLANADGKAASALASFVTARGLSRLGNDFAVALAGISVGNPKDGDYHAGANLLSVSLRREKAALESCRALAPAGSGESGGAQETLSQGKAALEQAARQMQAQLSSTFRLAAGREPAPLADPVLQRLAKRVPRRAVATLDEWMKLKERVGDKREAEARAKREERERLAAAKERRGTRKPAKGPAEPKVAKLSNLMQFAVMNGIDGKVDAGEIARRVGAEALSAGSWYYGEATPEMVEKFLETQAKDGLIVW